MMDFVIDFSVDFYMYVVEWLKDSLMFIVDGYFVYYLMCFNVFIISRWSFYFILNIAVLLFGMFVVFN